MTTPRRRRGSDETRAYPVVFVRGQVGYFGASPMVAFGSTDL